MVSRFFGAGDPFGVLHREVNRVFDEVFRSVPQRAGLGGFAPDLDVHETDSGLELAAELPGVAERDIDLRLEGDLLTIAGEKRDSRQGGEGGRHMSERSYGRFQRSFRLPFAPDPGAVEARFEQGVLHVTLPRPAQSRAGGRIPIQGAPPGEGPGTPVPGGGNAQGVAPEEMSDQASGTPSRQARDKVEEAGRESFPASDPPAHTGITGTTG